MEADILATTYNSIGLLDDINLQVSPDTFHEVLHNAGLILKALPFDLTFYLTSFFFIHF